MSNTDNPLVESNTAPHDSGNANNNMAEKYSHIPGWGMDADEENDPVYPMRHYNGADHQHIHYNKPPQQPATVEMLKSIERPSLSRVFGTTAPPQGFSGSIRRKAFEYSEANALHWMGLILADRVNMVEGLIEDFRSGHVPNLFAERGWAAEWKYNKKGVITNALIGAALIGSYIALSSSKKKKKKAAKTNAAKAAVPAVVVAKK